VRVYISVDMEGVAGIATTDQTVRGGHGYPRAQELMTGEANAAITGAFDAGATTVTVSDSHGTMDNLLHERLDERAELVFGTPRPHSMAQGLDESFDVALFVGYHAAAGERGVLSHTYSSLFGAFKLNDATVSEAEINALFAASQGVPIGLVTGDDVICAVADKQFPNVASVAVKTVEGWTAARSMHPTAARDAIRGGAASAVTTAGSLRPIAVPPRLIIELAMPVPTAAELAALVPGTERVDAITVRREVEDPRQLLGLVTVWSNLASSAERGRLALLSR